MTGRDRGKNDERAQKEWKKASRKEERRGSGGEATDSDALEDVKDRSIGSLVKECTD